MQVEGYVERSGVYLSVCGMGSDIGNVKNDGGICHGGLILILFPTP